MTALRTDRLATLYLFHPLRNVVWREGTRIPILMYHSISAGAIGSHHAYFGTTTTRQALEEQMNFLRENGYVGIGLDEAVTGIKSTGGIRDKYVVITFDDGFEDFYTDAFPILSKYGYTATVFLPTGYVGNCGEFNGIRCLNWTQARELQKFEIRFGSHTVTHPQLRGLTMPVMRYELQHSRQTIEDELGCAIRSFSYPYAFPEADANFTRQLRESLLESGYVNGVCTILGTADQTSDELFMERLPVNSRDDSALFRAKLEGGYDWLHAFQYTSKLITKQLGRHPKTSVSY